MTNYDELYNPISPEFSCLLPRNEIQFELASKAGDDFRSPFLPLHDFTKRVPN